MTSLSIENFISGGEDLTKHSKGITRRLFVYQTSDTITRHPMVYRFLLLTYSEPQPFTQLYPICSVFAYEKRDAKRD